VIFKSASKLTVTSCKIPREALSVPRS